MKKHPLFWFFILTFSITWGLAAIYFALNAVFKNIFGELSVVHPIFILAVWGPNIAALIVVAKTGGRPAIVRLLRKFIPVRANLLWYILAIFLFPLTGIIFNQISGDPLILLELPAGEVVTMVFAILISGPLGEELGWRGYALSRMLQKQSALAAGVILGLIWGVWHLPSFFAAGLPQMELQIPAFILTAVSLSVFVTWIFVNTKQNVFISFLLHYSVNFTYTLIGADFLYVAIAQAVLAALVILVFGRHLKVRKN